MLIAHFLLLVAFGPVSWSIAFRRNNVCRRFRDYYFPDGNKNCYYDPDILLDTAQIIKKYAGKVENYDVTTEDGYILRLFRIPRADPKGVVLMHHSIATHSQIYFWQGNNSLAFTLWQNGFDVWLANQRGTRHSDRHVNLTHYDFSYWNFSFHEMGLYDVTSEINFIRTKTNGSQVIFFGHSLGSLLGLVYATLKPVEAEHYVKTMVLLAPPAYLGHSTSAIYRFRGLYPILLSIMETLRQGSALLTLPLLIPISRIILRLFPFFLFVSSVLLWEVCGYTPPETDPTFFNYDGVVYGDNFSWKTLTHLVQLSEAGRKFQLFDYGKDRNMEIYGQTVPPLYPLGNISVPILIVSSYNDSLVSLQDCDNLYQDLPPIAQTYGQWKLSGLNHLDYHIGLHRRELFANRFVSFLLSL